MVASDRVNDECTTDKGNANTAIKQKQGLNSNVSH